MVRASRLVLPLFVTALGVTCGKNEITPAENPNPIERACGLPPPTAPDYRAPVSFYRRWSPIYRGTTVGEVPVGPSQTNVKQAIDPERIAVLSGTLRRKGDIGPTVSGGTDGPLLGTTRHPALPCATVAVLGRDYGQTRTRITGRYELAVNGDGPLTLVFSAPGFLPAQRTVRADPLVYTSVPDVLLLPADRPLQRVTLGAARTDVAEVSGPVEREGALERQATLLIMPGTSAELVLSADGKVRKKLDELQLALYEHTVGEAGPAAMPASIPPGTDYTYAVTFYEAQATSVGALRLEFDPAHPAISYQENFLGFPVGTVVPSGFYDERAGRWVPSDNGRVVRIHDIVKSEGEDLAEIEASATGRPASDDTLERVLGMSRAERVYLAKRYRKGQSLWRVPLSHLTPYDYNWVLAPPRDAKPPPREDLPRRADADDLLQGRCWDDSSDPKLLAGGDLIVDCKRQALALRFVIPDTKSRLALHLDSRRTPSFLPQAALWVPLTYQNLGAVPDSLQRIDLTVSVERLPDRVFHFPINPGERDRYRGWSTILSDLWDGSGGVEAQARVRIDYRYLGDYASLSEAIDRVFGLGLPAGVFTRVAASSGHDIYTISHTYDPVVLGSLRNPALPVGGLGLSEFHFYQRERRLLRLGNGQERSVGAVLPLRAQLVVGSSEGLPLRRPGPLFAFGLDVLISDTASCGLRVLRGASLDWLVGKEPVDLNPPTCALTANMDPNADKPLAATAGLVLNAATNPQRLFFAVPSWGRVYWLQNRDILGADIKSSQVLAVAGGLQQEPAMLQNPLELRLDQPRALALANHPDGKRQVLFIAEATGVRILAVPLNPPTTADQWKKDTDWSVGRLAATLARPQGLALANRDDKGPLTLYVADTGNDCVREYVDTSKVAGAWETAKEQTPAFGQCGMPGLADGANARFLRPTGVHYDKDADVLYVVDQGNGRVRLIDLKTRRVTTVLGPRPEAQGQSTMRCDGASRWSEQVLLGIPGNLDPAALTPAGITMTSDRRLFVSDPENHSICAVTPAATFDKELRADRVDLVPSDGNSPPAFLYEFYRGPDLGPGGEEPGEHLRTLRGDNTAVVVHQFRSATLGGRRRLAGVRLCGNADCSQAEELGLVWSGDGEFIQEMKTPARRSLYFLQAPQSSFVSTVKGPQGEPMLTLDYQDRQVGLPSAIVRSVDAQGNQLPREKVERFDGIAWDRSGRLLKFGGQPVSSGPRP